MLTWTLAAFPLYIQHLSLPRWSWKYDSSRTISSEIFRLNGKQKNNMLCWVKFRPGKPKNSGLLNVVFLYPTDIGQNVCCDEYFCIDLKRVAQFMIIMHELCVSLLSRSPYLVNSFLLFMHCASRSPSFRYRWLWLTRWLTLAMNMCEARMKNMWLRASVIKLSGV